ncbi:MAG: hypothetical protein AABX14_04795 [Candidatus Aenigmatarchaeota archaeon]
MTDISKINYRIGRTNAAPLQRGERRCFVVDYDMRQGVEDFVKGRNLITPATATFYLANMSDNGVARVYRMHRVGGGGNCYIDEKSNLVLDESSEEFGAIPKSAAERFVKMLVMELERARVEINSTAVNPNGQLNDCWRSYCPTDVSTQEQWNASRWDCSW